MSVSGASIAEPTTTSPLTTFRRSCCWRGLILRISSQGTLECQFDDAARPLGGIDTFGRFVTVSAADRWITRIGNSGLDERLVEWHGSCFRRSNAILCRLEGTGQLTEHLVAQKRYAIINAQEPHPRLPE